MAFTTTPEQEQLRELVQRLCGDRARNRAPNEHGEIGDAELWKQLVESGLTTLGVGESAGGAGGGVVDQVIVAEELGRAASPAPFVASTMMAGSVLAAGRGVDAIARLTTGQVAACAIEQDTDREVDTEAATVDGRARHVVDGPLADLFVVTGRSGTEIVVGVVDATATGVQRVDHPTLDRGRSLATVTFDRAPIRLLDVPEGGWAQALGQVRHVGAVGVAAESAGLARRCLDLSRDHALTRRQFGEVIGQFQATKHRLADMLVLAENAHAAVRLGAFALAGNGDDIELSVAAAKAVATEAAVEVAGHAIQLHGGIAITWEHDLHLYLRRAKTNQHLLGEPSVHRERIAVRLLAQAARGV